MAVIDRIRKGWNAFINKDEAETVPAGEVSYTSLSSSGRGRYGFSNEKSMLGAIYTRIAVDASAIEFWHVRNDEDDRYSETIKSDMHECLNTRANIDQAARQFRSNIFLDMCDKGVVAIVPVDTTTDPTKTGGFDIQSLRVGEVTEWFPRHVKVNVYNDRKGVREEVLLPKASVAIVENPLAPIMNAPNSLLQRLVRKLHLLDAIDEQVGSGKMNLIIQLPYTIKTERRQDQAEVRRNNLEKQLKDSKYGIAYADATERITQLNRPAENNLLESIEWLTNNLYSQLGISEDILKGSADEQTMLNYYNRTVEPITQAVCEELNSKFLTKTARTQKQAVISRRDPFRLVPINNIADIADKFTRNEILSSNELRDIIGYMPVRDPKADQLVNANINQAKEEGGESPEERKSDIRKQSEAGSENPN